MIQALEPDQWERFRELRLTALRDAPWAFGSTLERELAMDEEAWRARLAGRRQFVAIVEGEWLGTAAAIRADDGAGAELVSMWVTPSARGSAVAGLLVDAVIAAALADGHPTISLRVAEGNQRAERLYHRHGFRRTGRTMPIRAEEPDRLEFEMELTLSGTWGDNVLVLA